MDAETPAPRARKATVRSLLVLVACAALWAWSGRRLLDSREVPALAREIRAGAATARVEAMGRLGRLSPDEARGAAQAVLAAAQDATPIVRAAAAEAIGYAYRPPCDADDMAIACGVLERLLDDPDAAVRRRAVAAIGHLVPLWRQATQGLVGDSKTQGFATLAAATRNPDPGVREEAVRVLPASTHDLPPILPYLLAATKDPAEGVRAAAITSLLGWTVTSDEARVAVAGASLDPSQRVRAAAGRAPIPIGKPRNLGVLDSVLAALDDPDPAVRRGALRRLADLGPAASGAAGKVLALAESLRRPGAAATLQERMDYLEAARTLGAVAPGSPEARSQIEAVLAILDDASRPGTQVEAARALGTFLWDERVVGDLELAREAPYPPLRRRAAESLLPPPAPARGTGNPD